MKMKSKATYMLCSSRHLTVRFRCLVVKRTMSKRKVNYEEINQNQCNAQWRCKPAERFYLPHHCAYLLLWRWCFCLDEHRPLYRLLCRHIPDIPGTGCVLYLGVNHGSLVLLS